MFIVEYFRPTGDICRSVKGGDSVAPVSFRAAGSALLRLRDCPGPNIFIDCRYCASILFFKFCVSRSSLAADMRPAAQCLVVLAEIEFETIFLFTLISSYGTKC